MLTFQASTQELDALSNVDHPRPVWRPDIVGLVLDVGVDWDEVAELLTESYCVLAPMKLVDLVGRPPG